MKRPGLGLVLAAALVASVGPWIPAPSVPGAACPVVRTACCCEPCPGVDRCPCDHRALPASGVCATSAPTPPLDLPEAVPTAPVRLVCEIPAPVEGASLARRFRPCESNPVIPEFAEPPDKVPLG